MIVTFTSESVSMGHLFIYSCIYVDDMLNVIKDKEEIKKFKVKILGVEKKIFGVEIHRDSQIDKPKSRKEH